MALQKILGPSTAGLAQRIRTRYDVDDKNDELKILKTNYVMPCSTNQY